MKKYLDEARAFIRQKVSDFPSIAITLGSGLGNLLDEIRLEMLSYYFLGETVPFLIFKNKNTSDSIFDSQKKINKNDLKQIINAFDDNNLDLDVMSDDKEKIQKWHGLILNILKPTHEFPNRPSNLNELIDKLKHVAQKYGHESAWEVFHSVFDPDAGQDVETLSDFINLLKNSKK